MDILIDLICNVLIMKDENFNIFAHFPFLFLLELQKILYINDYNTLPAILQQFFSSLFMFNFIFLFCKTLGLCALLRNSFYMPRLLSKEIHQTFEQFFFFLSFFRAAPKAYGRSQARVEWKLWLPAYTTATPDPSDTCDLPHSSGQCWILNPLSKAGNQTCILMGASQIRFR